MEYDIDFFGSEQYFLTHSNVVWVVKVVFFIEQVKLVGKYEPAQAQPYAWDLIKFSPKIQKEILNLK